jgi:hypothetical protein
MYNVETILFIDRFPDASSRLTSITGESLRVLLKINVDTISICFFFDEAKILILVFTLIRRSEELNENQLDNHENKKGVKDYNENMRSYV